MAEIGQTVEATGINVEAAIAAGLERLGVEQDEVEIEVLDEGGRGVFGLGRREARVRLIAKPRPVTVSPEPEAPPTAHPAAPAAEQSDAEIAQSVLLGLLAHLGMGKARVEVQQGAPASGTEESQLMLNLTGPDVGALIGRRGETLAALQYLVRLMVGQKTSKRVRLTLDVEGFKTRRGEALRRLAQRMAEQAVRTGRTVTLEPMPPHERRIIHLALRDHPQVTTESVGEGERRKVTIIPKRP